MFRSERIRFLFQYLIVFVLLLAACKEKTPDSDKIAFSMSDTMLQRCRFFKVNIQEVKNQIRLFGKISADNNKMAQVYPVVGGVVKSIHVELGDYVQQGQMMATIQSGEVAEFRKEKLDAMNDLAMSEKNLQVARDLYQGKLNSEKDVIAAERELEKSKAELARINEIYTIYKLEKGSEYVIYAPISGFVVTKKINQNEQIRTDDPEPLFAIAEINEVWALANVNESDISKVKVGFDVKISTLAFPDNDYSGKIDKIFNAIDPETKSMKVRVKIPNSDFKLKPFMNCTFNITYSENRNMTAVPSSAVIFDKSKYWVMVFKDRYNIETRKVEVYRQLGDVAYISFGVKEGERVISQNAMLIYDALND